MQRIIFIIIAFFLSLSINNDLEAQITGGGDSQSPQPSQSRSTDLIDRCDFVALGFSFPTGQFGADGGLNAGFAKTGMNIKYGGIRYFPVDLDTDAVALGYNFPLNFSFNYWENISITGFNYRPYFFIGIGLGPMITINPADEMIIDLFFNAVPTVTVFGGGKDPVTDTNIYSDPAFGLLFNYGVNLRYRIFFFGIDLMPGNFDYKVNTLTGGSEIPGSPSTNTISTGRLNLSFGLYF